VPGTAVATVALALIGALAVACFVQVAGVAFLGAARSAAPARAHDPPGSMTLPMAALAAGCLALGLFPGPLAPLLDRAVASWVGASLAPPPLGALAPLGRVTLLGLLLVGVAGAGALALARVTRRGRAAERPTWDCGYAEPGPRMQYTGSSFGQTLVELFAFVLWPKSHRRRLDGLFPRGGRFRRAVPDPVLDRMVVPLFRGVARGVRRLRVLQQGQTQVYVLYLLLVLVALLLWGAMGGPQ
jgi:hydrogenase-4 component B